MVIIRHASVGVYRILVGNKCDLQDKRQVSFDQGKEFADSYGMKFIETSAKTSENVGESFIDMTKDIVSMLKEKPSGDNKDKTIDISKNKTTDIAIKKTNCCN